MKKTVVIIISCFLSNLSIAQDFIPIWKGAAMPNSKGLIVKDSIANERVYQVGPPGFYVFTPSEAENNGVAVLIIPGGGYARLAYQVSGFQLAKWFNTLGVTAFVLNHRLPQSPDVIESCKAPVQDGQRALRYIRANAELWKIDLKKVGVMGCSAGGHLSACLSTFDDDWSKAGDNLDLFKFKPDFTLLISPVISMGEVAHKGSCNRLLGEDATTEQKDLFSCEKRVTEFTPPAFMVHATDDKAVSSLNSILYYTALKQKNVRGASLHIFPEGGHNIALRNNPGGTDRWSLLAEEWLIDIGILPLKKVTAIAR